MTQGREFGRRTLLALTLAVAAAPAGAEDAGRILERAVSALGGAAAVDGVKTLEVHGTTSRRLEGGGTLEVPMRTYAQPPDRLRQEVRPPSGWAYSLLNPDGAFFVEVNRSSMPLEGAARARLAAELRTNPVLLLQERARPGVTAAPGGTRTVDGAQADVVEVTAPGLPTIAVAVDRASGLVRQMWVKPEDGVAWTFTDYRSLEGGLEYPFRARARKGGEDVIDLRVEKVLVNAPLEARVFRTPSPATFMDPSAPIPPSGVSMPSVPRGASLPSRSPEGAGRR